MTAILPSMTIRCEFSVVQLELIEAALNQMSWRDREHKDDISKTLAVVQMNRRFGERVIR